MFDRNSAVNARRIESNDQNFAMTNVNDNLNQTVIRTKLAYAAGDVYAGADSNISTAYYAHNTDATNTILYAIDYDLDSLVMIAPPLMATGSSNTGGGQLQTIGHLVDSDGNLVNLNPTSNIDIYTDANGTNYLVGINDGTIFTIDLSQINPSPALGSTQQVAVNGVKLTASPSADAFIDIAILPYVAPTPKPSPAPTGGGSCTVSYQVTGQWQSGFVANVLIQNNTGNNLNGWQFSFSFTGNQSISSLWDGTINQAGQSVTVYNGGFNKIFANGSQVSFGFQASYSGSNPIPAAFTLNGIPCKRK